MRNMTIAAATILALAAMPTSLSAAAGPPPHDAVQEVIKVEDEWRAARIAGDVAFLDRFYAVEARIQGMDGKALRKADDIAMFASGRIKPKFIDHGPLNVDIYGQVAVVTGVDHLGGTAFGHYGEMWLRFTDVLVKRDGRWQLVVQQTTPTTDTQ